MMMPMFPAMLPAGMTRVLLVSEKSAAVAVPPMTEYEIDTGTADVQASLTGRKTGLVADSSPFEAVTLNSARVCNVVKTAGLTSQFVP